MYQSPLGASNSLMKTGMVRLDIAMSALPEHWLYEKLYFILYFVKIRIRLLRSGRAENCSAGPKVRLKNAGRLFFGDCWTCHDKGCY